MRCIALTLSSIISGLGVDCSTGMNEIPLLVEQHQKNSVLVDPKLWYERTIRLFNQYQRWDVQESD
jgi:hypothetical protein